VVLLQPRRGWTYALVGLLAAACGAAAMLAFT
jgi:hypothetical protein